MSKKTAIHFVGIGGYGMSALAEVMQSRGYRVTGSDRAESPIAVRLESRGIEVQYHHEPDLVKKADILVYTSAVNISNPEIQYALQKGMIVMRRAEMLGDLMRMNFSIGVSGTHGKTTTTAIIGNIIDFSGADPVVIVGGTFMDKGSNSLTGNGNIMVAEADEYDRSLLSLYPAIAVVTNIEPDHLDCYRDISDIKRVFREYVSRVPFYGSVIACIDDNNVSETVEGINKNVVTYGLTEKAEFRAEDIRTTPEGTVFTVMNGKNCMGDIATQLIGEHNVRNCLAAVAVCSRLEISFETIKKGFSRFRGVKRRFEISGVEKGITVIDDYAHHPSEITATLNAARLKGFKKITVVFQPHLLSRTRDFFNDFAKALSAADNVIVTDIYRARTENEIDVKSSDLVDLILKSKDIDAKYVSDLGDLPQKIVPELSEGDAVIMMGAGDIGNSAVRILERIRRE